MDNPFITFFSFETKNLCPLLSELHKHFGIVINQTVFQDESSLIFNLKTKSSSDFEIELIALDLVNSEIEDISNINTVCFYRPKAIKLIISDKNQSEKIQKQIENSDKVVFLNFPWKPDEIEHALNDVSTIISNLHKANQIKDNGKILNDKIQKKVDERLEKLVEANLAKDRFLSIIAHDLKSSFFAMQGISEILLKDWENLTGDEKLDLIGDIYNTSDNTFKLLENLLEWTKLQKEKLVVNISEVKIQKLLDSTLKIVQNNASLKGIKIQNKIDNDIKVQTDERMIATVFRNLISNAVQHIPPGGVVDITASKENDICTFCVADNGAGIDKPDLLELFHRGNHSNLNGNISVFKGLGLIICKDFIEKTGGEIWLETQKGQGSKFFFTVPC